MKRIEYALRIGYTHFDTPAKLRDMIGYCKKAGIREVQLVPVDYLNASVFPPRKVIAARRAKLAGIINGLRQAGIDAGYCVVRTFMVLSADGKDYIGFKQGRMDMTGKTATLHPCPLDEIYLDYIKYFYTELALTGPSTMVVDDDYRYERISGLGPTCFCPLHLKEFNRRYGHKMHRASLNAELEQAKLGRIKKDWMEFKRVLLLELARELRETVHKVNPNIRLGLMLTSTEISALEGRDHRELVETFAGDLQPLVRPGQGCYYEQNRLALLSGLADTVYQSSLMSEDTEIQAEVDFYPHTLFNKSAQFGFDYQIKANLACGIKKINIWPFARNHVVTEQHPFADIMSRNNRVLDRIASLIPDRAEMQGVHIEYSQKAAQLRPQRPQDAVKGGLSDIPVILWRLGIPFTFKDNETVVLTRDSFPMPRARLETILRDKHIFIDSDALALLLKSGMARGIGIKIAGQLDPQDYTREFFTSDARNGTVRGHYIATRWGMGEIVRLSPTGARWRKLTRLVRINGGLAEPGMLAAEIKGRRMVICAGRLRDTPFWANEIKQVQIQTVLSWLAGGVLSAVVRNAPDVCPVLLEDKKTKMRVLSLINASTACADGFTVELPARRAPTARQVQFMDDGGKLENIPAACISKRGKILSVKVSGAAKLQPYQVRTLFI